MRGLILATALALTLVLGAAAPAARADADSGRHYYLSLGDSLAAGTNATEVGVAFTDLGYADQLHAALAVDDPKLELVKLGCPGESAVSMHFGSQLPSVVSSCGSPRFYKNFLYSKGTQLAEAVSFLEAHKGKVALVTINIGAGDLNRDDAQGNLVVCLFEPAGCAFEAARLAENLAAILAELKAAAGGDVPIVGMTYYNVFAPIWFDDQETALFIGARVDAINGTLTSTYAAAGVQVANVAGAFHNGEYPLSAQLVCAWTWFCSLLDTHTNTTGYGVIAQAFFDVIKP
jgi:lysophospholipase L1-like esterase